MEKRSIRRFLALCLAVITVVTSSMVAFAADKSPSGGKVVPDPVITSKSTNINPNTGKATIKFTGKNAVKYEVQYKARSAKRWATRTTTSNSYTFPVKSKGLYMFRVRAIGENGKKSKWSSISYRYNNKAKPTYTTPKTKQILVKTPATKGVSGYVIYYSTNKKMTNAKKVAVKANYLKKPLAVVKGKTYYLKVVPYVVKGGKTYYGAAVTKAVKAK